MQPYRPDAELIAAGGLAALERYEAGEPDADLGEAIDALSAAIAADSAHVDALAWEYHLAMTHGQRAVDTGAEPDWHAAVEHMRHVWNEVGGDPEDAADVAPGLALLLFRRFHALRGDWDAPQTRQRWVELGDEVDDLHDGGPFVMMIRGLIRLAGYLIGGDTADRDEALELLGPALAELADDDPLVPEALGEYALALDDVADDDEVAGAVRRDRAIEALERAFTVLAPEDHPDLVRLEGELRCVRGNDADDVDELRRGLDRAILFVRIADPDDTDLPFCWYMRAMAHERLWYLTKEPAERDGVVACCDAALAIGLPDDETLDTHRRAFDMAHLQLTGAENEDATLRIVRTRFDAAVAALDERPGAGAGERAEVALAIAWGGFRLYLAAPGAVDMPALQHHANLAMEHPDPPLEWDTRLSALSPLRLLPGYQEPPPGSRRLPEFSATWLTSQLGEEVGGEFARGTAMMAYFDAIQSGDRSRLRAARDLLARLDSPNDELLAALVDGLIAHQDGATVADNIIAMGRILAAAETGPQDGWTTYNVATLRTVLAGLTGRTFVDRVATWGRSRRRSTPGPTS